jgi:transposase
MKRSRLKINWQEDEKTLYRLYKEEPKAEVRVRYHALWLLRRGHSAIEVAEMLGVCLRSIRTWISWYKEAGSTSMKEHLTGGRQGQKPYLTKEQEEKLIEHAKKGHITTINDASKWIKQEFGVTYTIWGTRSLLARLKIKKKVPRPIADKASMHEQEEWKKGVYLPPLKKTA